MTTSVPGSLPPKAHQVGLPGTVAGPTLEMPEPIPQPPAAAGIGLRIGSRALGAALGMGVWLVSGFAAGLVLAPVWSSLVALSATLAFGLLQWSMLATRGWTLERRWLGLRVVRAEGWSAPGYGSAFVRELLLSLASGLTCGIGGIVIAVLTARDDRHQGWHDKTAGTIVVRADSLVPVADVGSAVRLPATGTVTVPTPPTPSSVVAPPSQGIITGPGQVAPRSPVELTQITAAPPSKLVARSPIHTSVPSESLAVLPDVETAEVQTIARTPRAGVWTLRLPDGSSEAVGHAVVVGRDPVAVSSPGARLLAVQDSTSSVSKTHALFSVSNNSAWVEDLNSTNGVVVVRTDGDHELVPGNRAELLEGDEVYLGDLLIRVTRVYGDSSP